MLDSRPDETPMQVLGSLLRPAFPLLLQIEVLDDVAEVVDDDPHRGGEPRLAVRLPMPDHLHLVPDLVHLDRALGAYNHRDRRRNPVPVDVVAARADEAGRELDDLAGDGERDGDPGGGGVGVGGGHDDARPPPLVVERLDDVVGLESRRVGRRRARADVGRREGLGQHAFVVVGEEVHVADGVARGAAVAARGREVEDGGLEPGPVEAVVVDADLDRGAGRQRHRMVHRVARGMGPVGRPASAWRPRPPVRLRGLAPPQAPRAPAPAPAPALALAPAGAAAPPRRRRAAGCGGGHWGSERDSGAGVWGKYYWGFGWEGGNGMGWGERQASEHSRRGPGFCALDAGVVGATGTGVDLCHRRVGHRRGNGWRAPPVSQASRPVLRCVWTEARKPLQRSSGRGAGATWRGAGQLAGVVVGRFGGTRCQWGRDEKARATHGYGTGEEGGREACSCAVVLSRLHVVAGDEGCGASGIVSWGLRESSGALQHHQRCDRSEGVCGKRTDLFQIVSSIK